MPNFASQFSQHVQNTNNSDCAGDGVVNRFYIDVTPAMLVAGNIFDIGILPAGHTVIDAILCPTDLDTNGTPTITLDVGIMSGFIGNTTDVRTSGAEIFAASNAAQTGSVARPTLPSAFSITAAPINRSIGVKVVTGPATAAAGRIKLIVWVAPVNSGEVY